MIGWLIHRCLIGCLCSFSVSLQEWAIQKIKAATFMKLDEEAKKKAYAQTEKSLQVQMKPAKKVFTTVDAKEHTLRLLPATTKIDVRAATKEAPSGVFMYETSVNVNGEDYMVTLQPQTSKECLSPFWFVRTSTDPEEVNMSLDRTKGVPVLSNIVAVAAGDELVREKVGAAAVVAEELQPVMKRQRGKK